MLFEQIGEEASRPNMIGASKRNAAEPAGCPLAAQTVERLAESHSGMEHGSKLTEENGLRAH